MCNKSKVYYYSCKLLTCCLRLRLETLKSLKICVYKYIFFMITDALQLTSDNSKILFGNFNIFMYNYFLCHTIPLHVENWMIQ